MTAADECTPRTRLTRARSLVSARGERRFGFGKNWRSFLTLLDDERVRQAEESIVRLLGSGAVTGRRFLDVGCGSGIFSLAALRLGAERVHSFDYDLDSVACAHELRASRTASDGRWTVERGDVLDESYVRGLGTWDVVYSWGVLHHTGKLWDALDHATRLVAPAGMLIVAIYNDQGWVSRLWRGVKAFANRGPVAWAVVVGVFVPFFATVALVKDVLLLRRDPRLRYRAYVRNRGMSLVHDWLDWIGGYPFEVARPDQVAEFLTARGLVARRIDAIRAGHACNEFVFAKPAAAVG